VKTASRGGHLDGPDALSEDNTTGKVGPNKSEYDGI
jgi:hypothetical protein